MVLSGNIAHPPPGAPQSQIHLTCTAASEFYIAVSASCSLLYPVPLPCHPFEKDEINFSDICGDSAALQNIITLAKQISTGDSSVLIRGESGTGKELFARSIHYASNRRHKPFVAINCASIPDTLLESELFGYERGAFSGANTSGKVGRFELANGGTLFLDEIGDMPLHLQPKLLRVLQDGFFLRLGGKKTIKVNFRLITATN